VKRLSRRCKVSDPIGGTSNGVTKMDQPEPEDERIDAQGRRSQWQRPELRRIEAGSAEAAFNTAPDGAPLFGS
jgi:hypothetical protein